MTEGKTETTSRSFRFYWHEPNREKRRIKWLVAGIFVVLVVGYFVWGILPEPAFESAKLMGMTPNQIVARFGPPDVQYKQMGQPAYVYYKRFSWCALSYSILFKRGRVWKVAVGSH